MKGAVIDVVIFHNEKQSVDAYLYRLNRCLFVTFTNGAIMLSQNDQLTTKNDKTLLLS